jgi:hypothetical protein
MGNSVFVDEQLTPHTDQWRFLDGCSGDSEPRAKGRRQGFGR